MQSSIPVNADTQTHTHTGTVGNPKSGDGSQNLCQTIRPITQNFIPGLRGSTIFR